MDELKSFYTSIIIILLFITSIFIVGFITDYKKEELKYCNVELKCSEKICNYDILIKNTSLNVTLEGSANMCVKNRNI